MASKKLKDLEWVGSSKKDLLSLPEDVRAVMGFALHLAQTGGKHLAAKPLKGLKGGGVLEIVEDYNTDTYRAVYTVRYGHKVYVLHVFQKKSKRGIETPRRDLELIESRLKAVIAKEKGVRK